MSTSYYSRTLVITGLSPKVTESVLSEALRSVQPEAVFVRSDVAGVSLKAFILFERADSASSALEQELKLEGKVLQVRAAVKLDESELASAVQGVSQKPYLTDLEQSLRGLSPADLQALLSRLSTSSVQGSESLAESHRDVSDRGEDARQLGAAGVQSGVSQAGPIVAQAPRIALFSGDGTKDEPPKGELSYNQWRYEVRCLQKEGYSSPVILRTIRHSVRGTAAKVLRCLREDSSLDTVLSKFEDSFKPYLSKDQLFPLFYAAQQGPDERVEVWGCRIEDLITQIVEQGGISQEASRDMLKTKFWFGLRDARLREATRYRLESDCSYEELFRAVRKVEQEFLNREVPRSKEVGRPVAKQQNVVGDQNLLEVVTGIASDVKQIKGGLVSLEKRVDELEKAQSPATHGNRIALSDAPKDSTPFRKRKGPVCYRCGRVGHVKSKCVAKFHLKGHPLNQETPSPGGKSEGAAQ